MAKTPQAKATGVATVRTWTSWQVAWDAWRASRGGPAAIAARQRARLESLVALARVHSRFYAERYSHLPDQLTSLEHLPAVTKPELMTRFDDWVTDPAVTRAGVEAFIADPTRIGEDFLGRYAVWTTSGVTGTPAILVQDRTALAVMTGLSYVRGLAVATPVDLLRVLARGARQAAILATGGHFLGAVMVVRRRADPLRARIVRIFSVLTPLPDLVRDLNAFQPALLGSYPSMLALLAEEQEAGRLRIWPVLIASAGETLRPEVRAHITTAFRARVFDSYSASEAAPLALECRCGRLHVNADWFILEPVDASYHSVPLGQPSYTVLVTNLANRVQPIIRYDLGDSVTISPDPCLCGSPLPVITVTGRTDDILALPAADGRTVQVTPLAIGTVVELTDGVHRFQVIQTARAILRIRLEPEPGFSLEAVWTGVQCRLREYLAAQGVHDVELLLDSEPPRPDPRSGKFRQVWRALDHNLPGSLTALGH